MAIQFNCPYCTSQIRVPDSAGGKRGTCPRCRAKILVPKVKAKAKAKQPQHSAPGDSSGAKSPREIAAEPPDFSSLPVEPEPPPNGANPVQPLNAQSVESPAAGPQESAPPPLSPEAAMPTPAAEPATPFARAVKRRRRKRRFLWIPILLGMILVGGVALYFVYTSDPKLEGTLEAVIVPNSEVEPRTIRDAEIPGDDEAVQNVLKHLQENPLPDLESDMALMTHVVTATPDGLSVRVYDTHAVRFFRVDVRDDESLAKYLKDHAERLDEPRVEEMQRGLKKFFAGSAKSLDEGAGIPTPIREILRREVLVNALVRAAGYHLVANVKGTLYLCMYEDDRGRLYYLLPKGTKKFSLRGRKLSDGTRPFPGNYTVEVTGELEPKTTAGPSRKTVPEDE